MTTTFTAAPIPCPQPGCAGTAAPFYTLASAAGSTGVARRCSACGHVAAEVLASPNDTPAGVRLVRDELMRLTRAA